jgi:hypothetical protein
MGLHHRECGIFIPGMGAGGTIYVASEDKKFYAFNPDGSLQWTCNTGGLMTSSPALGPDGVLYFGAYDRRLYAVYSDSPGLAKAAWPRFRHDLYRTGRWAQWLSSCGGVINLLLLGD